MKGLLPLLAILILAGCGESGKPLLFEAYVWQRLWSSAVVEAVQRPDEALRGLRVLAAHRERGGELVPVVPDWDSLRAAERPVTMVVRLEGALCPSEPIAALEREWRAAVPMLLAGVEIDHDSPTARLPDYASFLSELRQRLPPGTRLSATILPTWLDSPSLSELGEATDETVLQLHSVMAADIGIFSRPQARRWIERYAGQSRKPFRIALPTYGIRLARQEDGMVLAVESEVPLIAGGVEGSEVRVRPEEIAGLLKDLQQDRPKHLIGVNWFRLPVAGDRRNWSAATLHAVMIGAPVTGEVRIVAEPGTSPGLFLLRAVNEGEIDAALPRRIALPQECGEADGGNDYRIEQRHLVRRQDFPLHEGRNMIVGWARCSAIPGDIHGEP